MASKYDFAKEEDMTTFRRQCRVPEEVILRPFVDGEVVPEGSTVVNSYLLRRVGLTFPLSAFLCLMLRLLALPLDYCKPNLIRLILGVEAVNRRLQINLGINHILLSYKFVVIRNMGSFHLRVGGLSLLSGISFHNRGWEHFPKLVVSGPWMIEGENPLPLVFDASVTHDRVEQLRRGIRSVEGGCRSLVNEAHLAHFPYEHLVRVAELESSAPLDWPVRPPGFVLKRRSSARLRAIGLGTSVARDEGIVSLSEDSDCLGGGPSLPKVEDDVPVVRIGLFGGSTHERGQSSRGNAGGDASISQLIEDLSEEVRDLKRRCLALEEENISLNRHVLQNYAAAQYFKERLTDVELKTNDL